MDELLGMLIYMDDGLIKDLFSGVLNGFIEILTCRNIQDRTLKGNAFAIGRDTNYCENRDFRDEREGFKSTNTTNAENCTNHRESNSGLEDRIFFRTEEEVKRIFTTFSFHSKLITQLKSQNQIVQVNNNNINLNSTHEGMYAEIEGVISNISMVSYVEGLYNILLAFPDVYIDKVIGGDPLKGYNCETIKNLLSSLLSLLKDNNSRDLVMHCGNTPIVMNVDKDKFFCAKGCMYDHIGCKCKVIGKLTKVCSDTECISLLRKCAQHDFYDKILKYIEDKIKPLRDTGLPLPEMCCSSMKEGALGIIPISIIV